MSRRRSRPGKASRAQSLSGDQAKSPRKTPPPTQRGSRQLYAGLGVLGVALVVVGVAVLWPRKPGFSPRAVASAAPRIGRQGPVTFNRDVAPIVFEKCAYCHRPGQPAPFTLLTYQDLRKHSREVASATRRGFMPPWLPEGGYGEFTRDRRLSADQLADIQQWVTNGMVEGRPADLPPAPQFLEGWQLGKPDLVVTLPDPYTLAAEGKDVYRNLVCPIPVTSLRYVKGVEFIPGNPRVVHHAFVNVDETRKSRRLAAKQTPPGFDGMELPDTATMPGGQLLGWQPGKAPSFASKGLAWVLRPNTDLVLQLHLHPSGKLETVQPKLGFYFTDDPPTNTPMRVALKCLTLDIPPNVPDYTVEQSYVLPVDLDILRVSPHAHYLAKEMQGYAILPNLEKRWLLWIKDWDFNWQGDYEYAQPQSFPKGTRLVMHYTYDNTTNNVRNPNQPPKRVRFGLQTTDEMGELWFQAVAHNREDDQTLRRNYMEYFIGVTREFDRFRLSLDPRDVESLVRLARSDQLAGRLDEAFSRLQTAIRIKPQDDQAHYELGVLYLSQNKLQAAEVELATAAQLNPEDNQAQGNLGWIYLQEHRTNEARTCFEAALRINPEDGAAKSLLEQIAPGRR